MGKHKKVIIKDAAFFRDRASELSSLYSVLNEQFSNQPSTRLHPLLEEIKNLNRIALGEGDPSVWHCEIKNLVLPVLDIRDITPQVSARVSMSWNFTTTPSTWKDKNVDPFMSYSFVLRVSGDYNGNEHSWGMHIDREAAKENEGKAKVADKKGAEEPEEWHPLYHLHCFDSRVNSPIVFVDQDKRKGSMLLNVPRVVHYPVDSFLGIGFYLTNFCKKDKFICFRKMNKFLKPYRESQERILAPYFQALSGGSGLWCEKMKLCPLLIQ